MCILIKLNYYSFRIEISTNKDKCGKMKEPFKRWSSNLSEIRLPTTTRVVNGKNLSMLLRV
jgi:hypothetical protein